MKLRRRTVLELRLLVVTLMAVATLWPLALFLATGGDQWHQQNAGNNYMMAQRPTTRKLQQSLQNQSFRPQQQLAWLMTFPNAGNSFTSRLVRDATLTDSASNYADETPSGQNGLRLPVFDDQPEGPFWIKPEESPEFTEPSRYILTKVCALLKGCLYEVIRCRRVSQTASI